jgi:hypothetical protein
MYPSSTSRRPARARTVLVLCVSFAGAGCLKKQGAEQHYYENHIQPILNGFCVGNTSPCHRVDPATGIALGNLDLSSFDAVQKRRDVLRTYGSYPKPLLLLKSLPEDRVQYNFLGKTYSSEIRHTGGKPLVPGSDAVYTLESWLENGANRDGILPVGKPSSGIAGCNSTIPSGFVPPNVDKTSSAYLTFQNDVFPKLKDSCAYSTCHSSPQSDFYLTCGDSPENQLFNYVQAAGFVVAAPTPVEQSEILVRPLSVPGGGINHTGGVYFQNRMDATWLAWKDWATDVQMHPLPPEQKSMGRQFFEANVLPKLVQRGCALEGCHSPDGFNDFRLRPGAQGFLSTGALKRDYETTLLEFMALDSVDVRQSRVVKKATVGGITHRGGALLEDEGVAPGTACATPFPAAYDPTLKFDPKNPATAPAVCVLQEWHRIERMERAASVSTMAMGEMLPIAFISRMANDDNLLQFDNYQGQSDLKIAQATMGPGGQVASVGAAATVLGPTGACKSLTPNAVDVRGPEWSYDGTKLIFAARPSAASGFDLWELDVAGNTCKQLTADNGRKVNQVTVHNFDPVYAPDGSVVFASTRAGTVTLKNFYPNADLFRVLAPAMNFANPQQMTFLLNSELSPAFMQDGRVTMTTEKATAEFYQLSGRRMNWDLTDYHPLLAQRAQSTDTFTTDEHPSVDYQQATEIREGLDRNFILILSNPGWKGAGGALATFNRSIGPFQADRGEVTFLKSVVLVDAGAAALTGTKGTGVYRSPFSLPNGEIMASYAANVTDPTAQTPKYDLVAVDAAGTRRMLLSDGTSSIVEATLGYKRSERILFDNLPQLVFGGHNDSSTGTATMHFPDLPLLATLLGANLRHGRNVKAFDGAAALRAYLESPPPAGTTDKMPPTSGLQGSQKVYTARQSLGSAGLASDHSLKVAVPAGKPIILELVDSSGTPLFTMSEEHQVTDGEYITPGAPRKFFNNICGGCHGSISGAELDVSVTADTLTGASVSMSRDVPATNFQ